MKPIHRRRNDYRGFALKTICAVVAAAFAESAASQAVPTGFSAPTAEATINSASTPTAMVIDQASQRAIINWTTFNIGNGASVTFRQPNTSSIAVNRVGEGGGRSAIDGALSANGNVWILNPNGVLFGSTAAINVAGLIASTGGIDDTNFRSSTTAPIAITGATSGSISNQGSITVANAGLAAFVAPSVSNSGTITATGGRIVLASAQAATISMNGGLYEIAITQGIANGTLINTGTLTTGAAAGSIVLSALDAANVVSGTINLEGIQQASRIEVHGGHVVLKSDLEATTVTGTSSSIEVHNGAHIQDAVDIAKTGAAIDIWGGTYTEGHANVDEFGAAGGQKFGLHVYKDNLLIRGLNASGAALTGLDDSAMPVVTAQYQTGFGAQHFISGSGVTIDGLKFKPASGGDNKTLEVIGNDFTLKNSVIDNSGNATAIAFYISDFSVPGDPFTLRGRPDVETFHIQNNRFIAGTSSSALVKVASGTGNSTAPSNRVFSGNELIGNPGVTGAVGFQIQGQEVGIPWQTLTAGAVTVQNNKFSNFDAPVRTIGVMTQELDWNSVFNNNVFVGGAALAFAGNTTTARSGTVAVAAEDGSHTSHDIIDTRITRNIQSSIDRAQAGDTVRALAGTYAEQVTLNKAGLSLLGQSGAKLVVPDGAQVNGVTIGANDVTVSGLEIAGPVTSSYLTYPWESNITRGIVVGNGINRFTIANNNIHDVRNGILIDGRNTGSVTGNRIENTKSAISVQYTDGTGIAMSGNSQGPIGNEWGVNLHLNGFLEGGTIFTNPHAASPTLAWQQALLDLSNANGGWGVQDQGYTSSNRTQVAVATTGASNAQGSPLTPLNSIQSGINAVVAGGKVNVGTGTYAENLTIGKALTLRGAGAGNSIIAPASGNAIDVSGNIGATASVVIDGFTFTGATYGVQVAGSTVLGDLTVQNSDFLGNRQNGFFVNGNSRTGAPGLTNVSLLNDTFEHNGAVNPNSLGWGDILFNFYNGNATLSGVRIHGGGEYNGIQMRGASPTSNVPQNAGTVVFNDVTIDGTFLRPTGSIGTFNPDGPGAAIHLLEYASVANVAFNDVTLAPAIGHGLFIEGIGSTLNIGNTNFGTPDPTPRGTAVAQHPQQVSRNILAGSNSNNLLTYADARAAKFDGVAVSGMTNAQLFGIEDRVTDALDLSGLGLVRFKTGNVYVTHNSENAVSGAIGRGVAAATAGDTVNIEAGAYAGNLTINKALTLDGAGIGQTTLRSAVLHAGDAVTITDASNVTLSDLSIADYQYGLRINGTSHNATVERVAFDNNTYGLRTSTTTKADNFRMLDSTITGGVIGVQTYNGHQLVGGVETPTASFANALFQNVTVDGPTYKGFYFETANNLTLKNVTIRNAGNVGDDSHHFGHAVDINLKYGAYDSITFDNLVVENSGHSSGDATRAAISIKTRGIPGDSASYTVAPASLQHVNIIGGSITGSEGVGLRVETLSNGAAGQPTVAISGGTKFKDNGQDIAVDNTRVDARGAVFAADSGGHEVTVVDGFAIEDRVTHALDASGRGLVTWQQGNVYVTQSSGSIQRGVNAASAGETVHVASGTFAEDVLVSQQRNLLFNNSTLHRLTICDCAGGTGLGGTVTATDTATGFSFSVPVVLLADLVLDTSAANGRVSLGAVNGSVPGAQMLTVRAGTGRVDLGDLGAGTRLGATDVAGGAIHFTGASYKANAFRFDAPAMTLSQATTMFTTNGGSIMLIGDIQNADANPRALSLLAGTGDVTLFSGGTAGNPLGMLDVASNNFTLTGTLWVSGYDINALGLVTLSDHTLRSLGSGVSNTISAGGDVTGSTISEAGVQIRSEGDVIVNVTTQGDALVVANSVGGNFVADNIVIRGQENVTANVTAPHIVEVHSHGPVLVSGSAPVLVVDAPPGSAITGNFTEVTNAGSGLINVNGKPQGNAALTANADNSRVMPSEERIAGDSARSAAAPESSVSPAGTLSLLPPDSAAEVLDQGWPVELDLAPGNGRRRR
jgi:filamentous hemagglutinin family protein